MAGLDKVVRRNIEQMCMSWYFWLSVVMTAFLMISGYIYTDMISGKAYSMLNLILMKHPESVIEQAGLSWRDIYLMESPGYTWMFAPVIVSLPFIALICSGNTNSNIRFEMFRTGKKRYILGKIISGVLVAGMIMVTAQIIYGIICGIAMGSEDELTEKLSVYVFRTLGALLYGMVSAFPVLLLSSVIRNKYLVFSVPFMLNYFYTMLLNNGLRKLAGNDNLITDIRSILLQTNMQSFFLMKKSIMVIAAIWMILQFFIIYGIHYYVTERRCDCCER